MLIVESHQLQITEKHLVFNKKIDINAELQYNVCGGISRWINVNGYALKSKIHIL